MATLFFLYLNSIPLSLFSLRSAPSVTPRVIIGSWTVIVSVFTVVVVPLIVKSPSTKMLPPTLKLSETLKLPLTNVWLLRWVSPVIWTFSPTLNVDSKTVELATLNFPVIAACFAILIPPAVLIESVVVFKTSILLENVAKLVTFKLPFKSVVPWIDKLPETLTLLLNVESPPTLRVSFRVVEPDTFKLLFNIVELATSKELFKVVLSATVRVPPKLELLITSKSLFSFVLPFTSNVSPNVTDETTLKLPPTDVLPKTYKVLSIWPGPARLKLPFKIVLSLTVNVLFKRVGLDTFKLPCKFELPSTFNVPAILTLEATLISPLLINWPPINVSDATLNFELVAKSPVTLIVPIVIIFSPTDKFFPTSKFFVILTSSPTLKVDSKVAEPDKFTFLSKTTDSLNVTKLSNCDCAVTLNPPLIKTLSFTFKVLSIIREDENKTGPFTLTELFIIVSLATLKLPLITVFPLTSKVDFNVVASATVNVLSIAAPLKVKSPPTITFPEIFKSPPTYDVWETDK